MLDTVLATKSTTLKLQNNARIIGAVPFNETVHEVQVFIHGTYRLNEEAQPVVLMVSRELARRTGDNVRIIKPNKNGNGWEINSIGASVIDWSIPGFDITNHLDQLSYIMNYGMIKDRHFSHLNKARLLEMILQLNRTLHKTVMSEEMNILHILQESSSRIELYTGKVELELDEIDEDKFDFHDIPQLLGTFAKILSCNTNADRLRDYLSNGDFPNVPEWNDIPLFLGFVLYAYTYLGLHESATLTDNHVDSFLYAFTSSKHLTMKGFEATLMDIFAE